MTPLQFVKKWRPVVLTERAAAQEHFIDLCRLFDHPTPVEDDPLGERFTFEKGVKKAGGGDGFADVWKKGFFAWEYKKKKRNLDEALGQLSRYALALENPPLHVACDTDRFRVVTAYTNCVPKSYDFALDDLLNSCKRDLLACIFHDPKKLQPGATRSDLTRQAADKFSNLVQKLHKRYPKRAMEVGHLANQLVFLFFAEDVGILSPGFFRRVIAEMISRPSEAEELIAKFANGGRFGLDHLPWINGGLFDGREPLRLDIDDLALLKAAGSQDWAHVDPSIFGTLFERFMDPNKRAQIGAHYTDGANIQRVIAPTITVPLKAEWRQVHKKINQLTDKASKKGAKAVEWKRAEEARSVFLERLRYTYT